MLTLLLLLCVANEHRGSCRVVSFLVGPDLMGPLLLFEGMNMDGQGSRFSKRDTNTAIFLFYSILFLFLLLSRCSIPPHINLNLIPDGFNGSIHLEIMNP